MSEADFTGANLSAADLQRATLVGTDLENANLSNCCVYGVTAVNLRLEGALQKDLVITLPDEPTISVDNIQVAQFLYLLLSNSTLRRVIDTVSTKLVLILGRFTAKRESMLDSLRNELRCRNYVPIFSHPGLHARRDFTETLFTLAAMARFVIADVTDAASSPQELMAMASSIVVPIVPISQVASAPFAMFEDVGRKYHWVLTPIQYKTSKHITDFLRESVMTPAEAKVKELAERRKDLDRLA